MVEYKQVPALIEHLCKRKGHVVVAFPFAFNLNPFTDQFLHNRIPRQLTGPVDILAEILQAGIHAHTVAVQQNTGNREPAFRLLFPRF